MSLGEPTCHCPGGPGPHAAPLSSPSACRQWAPCVRAGAAKKSSCERAAAARRAAASRLKKNKQLHEPGACHTPRARAARRSWRCAAAFNQRAPIHIPCFPHAAASPLQRGLCRLPTGRGRSAPGLPCHTKRQALCNQATESAPPSVTTPAAQHWPARLPTSGPQSQSNTALHTQKHHTSGSDNALHQQQRVQNIASWARRPLLACIDGARATRAPPLPIVPKSARNQGTRVRTRHGP